MQILRVLACLVLCLVCLQSRALILVGANNDGDGGFVLGNEAGDFSNTDTTSFANIGWAQPFTLNQNSIATTLTVYLNDAFDSASQGATFDMKLTNMIGAGTTATNVLASGSQAFPSTPGGGHVGVDFDLGTLALGAGTYYLVLTSDSPVTHITTQDDLNNGMDCVPNELCGNVGGWGNNGSLVVTGFGSISSGPFIAFGSSSNGPGPALTDFDPAGTPNDTHANFLLQGTLATAAADVPEPGSVALIVLGLAGVVSVRKRERMRVTA